MDLKGRFRDWVDYEIGSRAAPALCQHLRDHDYRLYCYVEHGGRWERQAYHPSKGFFSAVGADDEEALLGILRQIWLLDALHGQPEPEVGPASDR